MLTKYPVSVFIITKNEEERLAYAINSVIDWVDEVIIIDSGSDDNTIAIAKNLGAATYFNKWPGYGEQKIFGASKCKNDWLLNIDADEAISEKLRDEICNLFDKNIIDQYHMYKLDIRIMSRFSNYPKKFAPANEPVRLYNKNYANFKDSTVHDSVVAKAGIHAKTAKLDNIVLHRCFKSYKHAVEKINFYSSMQALDMQQRGRVPSKIRIVIEPFFAFFKAFFLRRYFILGIDGFIESVLYSFARAIRLGKVIELEKERKFNEKTHNENK
ncbi:MAG: glycosyltransferase family 2 protein [Pseudomonadota bacterium]